MATWSERYQAGDRQRVWQELHSLEPLSMLPQRVREEVELVARHTMKRVALNIGSLYQRLVSVGYEFDSPELSFAPEKVASAVELDDLKTCVGAIPPAVEALLLTVGQVSFRGWLPASGSRDEWRDQYVDPLEILMNVPDSIENYEKRCSSEVDFGEVIHFELEFAGDYLHKNEVSGGVSTFIRLPSDEADGRVFEDDGVRFGEWIAKRTDDLSNSASDALPPPQGIWLVDYLRMYFESGGFRQVAGTRTYPVDFVHRLSEGLLQI